MSTFHDLGLAPTLLRAITEEGYESPTPIQQQAVPVVLAGKDLLGIAQTGTGKTAAFALPILHRLAANRRPPVRRGARCLVLSPTRELASQIADSFRTYGRHLGITVGTVFGGVAQGPQRTMLNRGVDVLVATPGRLLDHMGQGSADLAGTEIFVLDEADQMLDLGFVIPIRRIAAKLSAKRQNLFFSATMPPEIEKLAGELLREPVKIAVAPQATTIERVEQKVIHVDQARKRALLVELFANPDFTRTLVFTRTKRGADRVAKQLDAAGIEVASIHGNKSQRQREQALDAFKSARVRALIATDIAARGIDIDQVSHVINFELPEVPEAYVHRIGRTARAGAAGTAISLVDGSERGRLRDIERLTRQSIPSTDRRRDETLAADAAGAGFRERRGGARNGQRRDGSDRGRRRTSNDRAREARPAHAQGPAEIAIASPEARSAQPPERRERQGRKPMHGRRSHKPWAERREERNGIPAGRTEGPSRQRRDQGGHGPDHRASEHPNQNNGRGDQGGFRSRSQRAQGDGNWQGERRSASRSERPLDGRSRNDGAKPRNNEQRPQRSSRHLGKHDDQRGFRQRQREAREQRKTNSGDRSPTRAATMLAGLSFLKRSAPRV